MKVNVRPPLHHSNSREVPWAKKAHSDTDSHQLIQTPRDTDGRPRGGVRKGEERPPKAQAPWL